MKTITEAKYDELYCSMKCGTGDFPKKLKDACGLVATPYQSYCFFQNSDYIGDTENYTLMELLEMAGVEVVPDD